LVSGKKTNTIRGWMPLAITQFLRARYQNAEPEPGWSSGAIGACASSPSRRSSIRVPAIESPITT
jgi:hypothetical protein